MSDLKHKITYIEIAKKYAKTIELSIAKMVACLQESFKKVKLTPRNYTYQDFNYELQQRSNYTKEEWEEEVSSAVNLVKQSWKDFDGDPVFLTEEVFLNLLTHKYMYYNQVFGEQLAAINGIFDTGETICCPTMYVYAYDTQKSQLAGGMLVRREFTKPIQNNMFATRYINYGLEDVKTLKSPRKLGLAIKMHQYAVKLVHHLFRSWSTKITFNPIDDMAGILNKHGIIVEADNTKETYNCAYKTGIGKKTIVPEDWKTLIDPNFDFSNITKIFNEAHENWIYLGKLGDKTKLFKLKQKDPLLIEDLETGIAHQLLYDPERHLWLLSTDSEYIIIPFRIYNPEPNKCPVQIIAKS